MRLLGLAVAVTFFFVAHTFWEEGQKQESRADLLLAITFVFWGLIRVLRSFSRGSGAACANVSLVPLVALPELFAGVLMVMAVYEEERRRVERNMLALSNLNLATSSFAGGEIQKMLAQALDRVLNVVRIPAGALCLHYGDDGRAHVHRGHRHERRFLLRNAQQDDLDDYIVNLVARLGGLVVLRDLAQRFELGSAGKRRITSARPQAAARTRACAPSWESACKPRSGCSECCCSGRRTTATSPPPNCGCLLALGHQIGMAVENSYLVQQTARRSEELHMLNEIGRALSSTLEPDILFERIYAEMRRLFDVSSLFIAFYDQQDRTKCDSRSKCWTANGSPNGRARREITWSSMWCAPASRC